jgi:acyl-CoA synthetase (AMP-forming)/AMP-acid ligase II
MSVTPDKRRTIARLIETAAELHGDAVAIIDGAQQITYAQLYQRSRCFGSALVAGGVQPGDRVAIWAPNGAEWIIAYLGLIQAGATLVPLNTRFKGAEAAEILGRSRARVLITVTDFLGVDYADMLANTGATLPELTTIVVTGDVATPATVTWSKFIARPDEAGLAEVDRRCAVLSPDDPADILFTSGTTGVPKGALSTHSATLAVAQDWVTMVGLESGDRYLMINPYFHMFGLKAGILASIAAGATMVPLAVFDVDRALECVSDLKITVLPGPPTLYQSILDHPDRGRYDLSSLRVAVTGAADIPVELIRRVYAELPFSTVIAGYGLTEAGTASGTSASDSPAAIATTVGRARPQFDLRIVDDKGEEVDVDVVGEVLVRSPSVMTEYIDDPEATAAVLSADGWLRTGDLGRVDADGYLRITGRLKDMFTVGGFNVYPAEIESILLRHPGIRLVAVVGIPDLRMGEVGAAFVVPCDPNLTSAAVVEWSRSNMANYKVPRRVEIVDTLPLNATGKVQKLQLRAGLLERSGNGPAHEGV